MSALALFSVMVCAACGVGLLSLVRSIRSGFAARLAVPLLALAASLTVAVPAYADAYVTDLGGGPSAIYAYLNYFGYDADYYIEFWDDSDVTAYPTLAPYLALTFQGEDTGHWYVNAGGALWEWAKPDIQAELARWTSTVPFSNGGGGGQGGGGGGGAFPDEDGYVVLIASKISDSQRDKDPLWNLYNSNDGIPFSSCPDTIYVRIKDTVYSSFLNYIADYDVNWYLGNSSARSQRLTGFMLVASNGSIKSKKNNTWWYQDIITNESKRVYTSASGYATIIDGVTYVTFNGSAANVNINPDSETYQSWMYNVSTGSSVIVEPPAYPTMPEPPTGGGSTVTNVTYNITNNTTTADLQPILDALIVINRNLDEFSDMFVQFADELLTGLQEWFSVFLDAFDVMAKWLERIYFRIPTDFGGGGGGGPSDPVEDPTGFWRWLGDLIDDLVGDLPEGLGSFGDALGQLTGRFPFSVPWDMAALLGLLAHDPVTPVFDAPWMAFDGTSVSPVPSAIHVDLSPFDDAAAVVRGVLVVLFCVQLARWTFDAMQGLDDSLFGR